MSVEPTEVEYEAMLTGMVREWLRMQRDHEESSIEGHCKTLLRAAIDGAADDDILANAQRILDLRAQRKGTTA